MSLRIVEWPGIAGSAPAELKREESAMTVGVFDGLHLGHQELIERIVRRGPNPTVITFRENPKKAVNRILGTSHGVKNAFEGDIFSLRQKLAAFEGLGVSRLILIDFSEKFSKLTGGSFLDLLESWGMVFLALGNNFRCGYRQDTNAGLIKEINKRKGIPTEVVPPVAVGSGPVSSSRIRAAILEGDLVLAAALMGRKLELDLADIKSVDVPSEDIKSVDVPSEDIKSEDVKPVDIEPAGFLAFDFRSVQRIVPAPGQYITLLHPGAAECRVIIEGGKVLLPKERVIGQQDRGKIESLEFIVRV